MGNKEKRPNWMFIVAVIGVLLTAGTLLVDLYGDHDSSNTNNGTVVNGNNNIGAGSNVGNTIYKIDNSTVNIPTLTPTPTPTPAVAPVKPETKNNSIDMEFVRIPAGTFVMGDDEYGEYGEYACPEHTVDIGYNFYLGKYEVTQKQWVDVMGSNTSFEYLGDNYPAYNIIWDAAQDFVKKLNEKEHTNKYRLPSEAEWEYACRANTTTKYYFGDDASKLDDYEWYTRNSRRKIHPVGQKLPNPWGLYDMQGNIIELVRDDWDDAYSDTPSDGSAYSSSSELLYDIEVLRGGYYDGSAEQSRSAHRSWWSNNPDRISKEIGFRIVMEV